MKILPKHLPSEPKSGAWIWIFLIFDAKVASTGPGTYLKRCGSKFCVGWWSEYLHSFHMDPIGEETVPHGPTQTFPKRSQNSPRASQASPRAWVLRRRDHSCRTSVWCRPAPILGHAPDPLLSTGSTTFQRKRNQPVQNRPWVPRAGGQDYGSLPHKLPQIIHHPVPSVHYPSSFMYHPLSTIHHP